LRYVKVSRFFRALADKVSHAAGTWWAFSLALFLVAAWFVYGLIVGFSDTVQLVINTSTTIVTFLMVFLIQSTQNRDTRALHLKLDELVRVHEDASDEVIGAERSEDCN
jgi:low affinity Fe/Cu permease